MKPNRIHTFSQVLGLALLSCLVLVAASAEAADEPGYGFYRTVTGDVRLTTLDRAEPLDIEPNYPLLLGDRVWIAPGSRLEAVLPDQTILRAGGGTDLYFEDLALYADDSAGVGTVLRLLEGEVQVVVTDFGDGVEPLRIDTPNATVYLQDAGIYRVYADERQWTEVVVREGFGEVLLADGSVVVRANEEVVIDGASDPRVRVYPAGAIDDLEAWAAELDREAELAASGEHVDRELAYQAAPLREHGEWLPVDRGYAWRPRVAPGWRPYTHGRWTYTPAGLYWVSGYPWGALTFHYGSWSLHSYYGWVWYPGRVFSPAWVYWNWGPTYVGWVPSGYYTYYYGPRYAHHGGFQFGFHLGTYGYAGGSWGHYTYWTFSPVRHFGWRSYHTYWRSGAELHRHHRGTAVPRGVIARDTRGVDRRLWNRPDEVQEVLLRKRPGRSYVSSQVESRVPDVTGFVARKPSLTSDVRDAILSKPGEARSPVAKARPQGSTSGKVPTVAGRPAPGERSGGFIASRTPPTTRTLPPRPDRGRVDMVREPAAGRSAGSGSFIAGRETPSRSLAPSPVQPSAKSTLPRSPVVGGNSGSGGPTYRPREPEAGRIDERRGLPASPRLDSRRPTGSAISPSIQSPASASPGTETRRPAGSALRPSIQTPRSPSGVSSDPRLPASPSRQPAGSPRPSLQDSARWGTPPGSGFSSPAPKKAPIVQRVLDSIRGNRQVAPSVPTAPRFSAPAPGGGSSLRRTTPPSAVRPPSASSGAGPRVSSPPRTSPPRASRPSVSKAPGRSSTSSSSSSKSGQSASSSRSQSRSKTKPPG